jgi:hypothetical protein
MSYISATSSTLEWQHIKNVVNSRVQKEKRKDKPIPKSKKKVNATKADATKAYATKADATKATKVNVTKAKLIGKVQKPIRKTQKPIGKVQKLIRKVEKK